MSYLLSLEQFEFVCTVSMINIIIFFTYVFIYGLCYPDDLLLPNVIGLLLTIFNIYVIYNYNLSYDAFMALLTLLSFLNILILLNLINFFLKLSLYIDNLVNEYLKKKKLNISANQWWNSLSEEEKQRIKDHHAAPQHRCS